AAECRAYAIQNAPFADELDHHPDNVSPHAHPQFHQRKADKARVEALVRGHAADESRNKSAGEALDQFYQLAKAEGQFDLLALAHAELRTQLDAAMKAEKQGLRDRAGVDELRVQLLDLEAQMARLEAGIGQLNASLRARLGLDPKDPLPLWPDDPLRVRPDDVDAEQAVATGLYYRPDLNLLRVLASESGPGADEVRRQVLGGLNPLLAVAAKAVSPLAVVIEAWTHERQKDAAAQQRMVASVLVARERQAEAEIRAAVLDLHGHKAAAVANAAEVQRLSAKVAELEKRQKAGQQVTAELTKARLDLLKARGDVIKVAADWNIAEAKLRQAMGLLIRE
ncbi:MAG TPA: hypothetical protein VKE74_12340, partial [Gemmataceae bacterium]|nr:hypothetical protein [Gemmataceae bacterium]